MSSYLKSGMSRLADGLIYVLDEVKFWGEVVTEFMEIDSESKDR